MTKPKSIVFFHPDLGIGGAERLVIDAAVGLQNLGHRVTIFTSHRDPSHCFDEARDGTLDVRVRGNTLFPATLLGRFKILFAILRQYNLLISIALSSELGKLEPTAFFVDQLSAGIPLMRYLRPDTRILFYCHFPDLLLVQQRGQWWKRLWRLPFDWIEGWSMRGADRVVVNSGFTKKVVENVWGGLGGERGVGIVYPCVETGVRSTGQLETNGNGGKDEKPLWSGKKIVLSINRFERKKDVGLAIRAFARIREELRSGARLVVAGGYDSRVRENFAYHEELEALATKLGLNSATTKNVVTALSIPSDIEVLFLLSIPGQMKSMLLKAARLLVYTPSNEHFGIVPLEAMLAKVPVLAASNGGPLETVVDGETGWLRSPEEVNEWTLVIQEALSDISDDQLQRMGFAGKERVITEFSETEMAKRLDDEVKKMVEAPRVAFGHSQDFLLAVGLVGIVVVIIAAWAFRSRSSM